MKKCLLFFCFAMGCGALWGQSISSNPNVSIKWAPAGLAFGNIGLQAEYNFGKNSLTAKIGIPINKHETFKYDDKDADFTMKDMNFLAGYRTYLSKKHMAGLYFEPYFKYLQVTKRLHWLSCAAN